MPEKLALADQGIDAVSKKVSVEPSGEAFNQISLEHDTGRPRNPMINAGAITAASLVQGDSEADKLKRLLRCYSRFAGRPLKVDQSVYQSEKNTGHRNRAIAHMLSMSSDPNGTDLSASD